jgi:hypothetical protein
MKVKENICVFFFVLLVMVYDAANIDMKRKRRST